MTCKGMGILSRKKGGNSKKERKKKEMLKIKTIVKRIKSTSGFSGRESTANAEDTRDKGWIPGSGRFLGVGKAT